MTPTDLVATMPFAESLGMTISRATRDEVRAEVCWDAQRCTVAGAMHGGVLMSLADSAGAVCAFLNLPEGATTSTIESKTNFMRGVREGSATATSRPLHVGRTTVVVQTEVRDDRGKLVSLTTQTQAVIT